MLRNADGWDLTGLKRALLLPLIIVVAAAVFADSWADDLRLKDTGLVSLHRGNSQRTGEYRAPGIRELHGVKWKANVGGRGGDAVAVGDGVLCMGRSVYDGLYAFDMATGKQLWVYKTGNITSTPAIADGTVYFGAQDREVSRKDGGFVAVDLRSGKLKWQFKTGENEFTSPLVVGKVLYVTSQNGHLYALDSRTGKEYWKFRYVEFATDRPSSPVLDNSTLYFWGGGKAMGPKGRYINETFLFVIDAETGKELNRFDTFLGRGTNYTTSITVRREPVVVDGTIYFASDETLVLAMNASDGRIKWRFKAKGYVTAPVVSGGVVYFGDNSSYLYAVDAASGVEIWNYNTEGAQSAAPSVANGVIYFGGGAERFTRLGNYLYAMDLETRKVLWKFETDQPSPGKPGMARWPVSAPVVVGNSVYFSCWTKVYRLH